MNANEARGEGDGAGRALEDGAAASSGPRSHSNLWRAAGVALLAGGAALSLVGEVVLIAAVPQLGYEGAEAGWHTAWASIAAIFGGIVLTVGLLLLVAGARMALRLRADGGRRAWLPITGCLVLVTLAAGAIVANAAVRPNALPASGTVTVSLGARTNTYVYVQCDAADGGLTVVTEFPSTDGVALTIPPNGGTPILSGAIGGIGWHAIEDPRSTLNSDRSGTFSGTDEVSGAEVTGTFACE